MNLVTFIILLTGTATAFTPSNPNNRGPVTPPRSPATSEVESTRLGYLQNVGELSGFADTAATVRLADFPVFQGILPDSDENDLNAKLLSKLEVFSPEKGDVVIEGGSTWDSAFFVVDGTFACVDPDTKETIKTFGPGDSFGTVSLIIDNKDSKVTIQSLSNRATLYRLKATDFDEIVDDDTFTVLGVNYLKKKFLSNGPLVAGSAAIAGTMLLNLEPMPHVSGLGSLASPQGAFSQVFGAISEFYNAETLHAVVILACLGFVNRSVMQFLDVLEEKDEERRRLLD